MISHYYGKNFKRDQALNITSIYITFPFIGGQYGGFFLLREVSQTVSWGKGQEAYKENTVNNFLGRVR